MEIRFTETILSSPICKNYLTSEVVLWSLENVRNERKFHVPSEGITIPIRFSRDVEEFATQSKKRLNK